MRTPPNHQNARHSGEFGSKCRNAGEFVNASRFSVDSRLGALLARRANPEHFQQVILDQEGRVPGQGWRQLVHRAKGERHCRAAGGADQVVPVPRRTPNVRGVAILLDQARQHINGRQDFERAVNCGAPDRLLAGRKLAHQLLGGERPAVTENRFHDRSSRLRQPVAVLDEDV